MTIYPIGFIFALLTGLLSLDFIIKAWIYFAYKKKKILFHHEIGFTIASLILGQGETWKKRQDFIEDRVGKSYYFLALISGIGGLIGTAFIISTSIIKH